jgi:hypothetical protein
LTLNFLEDKAAEQSGWAQRIALRLFFSGRPGTLRCYAKAAMDTNKIITTVETEKRFMGKASSG